MVTGGAVKENAEFDTFRLLLQTSKRRRIIEAEKPVLLAWWQLRVMSFKE